MLHLLDYGLMLMDLCDDGQVAVLVGYCFICRDDDCVKWCVHWDLVATNLARPRDPLQLLDVEVELVECMCCGWELVTLYYNPVR